MGYKNVREPARFCFDNLTRIKLTKCIENKSTILIDSVSSLNSEVEGDKLIRMTLEELLCK